ncbi:MAG TPA: caspase family protein [Pyrinomonadaceae bacterium]|nr:caspase family protein [Pyrinomonadaceae bacterium]
MIPQTLARPWLLATFATSILALCPHAQANGQTSLPSASPVQAVAEARQISIEPQKTLPAKAKRWALVVGVDKYIDPQITGLRGAANDARTLADALVRYAGFPSDQVILLSTDQPIERQPTRVNLLRRLSNLAAAVPKDGLLLISFSGHGMERAGHAFLLPTDAQISDQISFLEDTAVSVTRMRDLIKGTGVGQVMVLLDACRNDPGGRADAPNPLTEAYVQGFNFDVRNREVQAFATIYATTVGQRAYEYTEKKQGYFTWAIVEGLKGGAANSQGEVTLSELVKFVQDAVPKRIAIDLGSGKQQKPFATIEGYKAEELVLSAPGANASSAAASIPSGSFVDPAAIELSFWDTIKSSQNADDFKAYLEKYPDGQFAVLARNRLNSAESSRAAEISRSTSQANEAQNALAELTFWSSIKENGGRDEIKAYLKKYPSGTFAAAARNRLRELDDSLDDSTWVGTSPGGDKFYEFKFSKGGMFSGSFFGGMSLFVSGQNKLEGSWSQSGNSINVVLSGRLKAQEFKATRSGDVIKGFWGALTYSFELNRVFAKPVVLKDEDESAPCNLRGMKITVFYRDKGGVNLSDIAARVAEKLRGSGAQIDVQKGNLKDLSEKVVFYNSQSQIAGRIVECVGDAAQLSPGDGGVSYTLPNVFQIYLQGASMSISSGTKKLK